MTTAERDRGVAARDGLRALALARAPLGINANAVAPGAIGTPMTAVARADATRAAAMLQRFPLGRFAEPEAAAAAIRFLLSGAASFITVQAPCVDGGCTVG